MWSIVQKMAVIVLGNFILIVLSLLSLGVGEVAFGLKELVLSPNWYICVAIVFFHFNRFMFCKNKALYKILPYLYSLVTVLFAYFFLVWLLTKFFNMFVWFLADDIMAAVSVMSFRYVVAWTLAEYLGKKVRNKMLSENIKTKVCAP